MADSTTFILLISALIIFLGYIGEQIFRNIVTNITANTMSIKEFVPGMA